MYHETAYQGKLKTDWSNFYKGGLKRTSGVYRPFVLSRSFYAGSQKFGKFIQWIE